MKRKFRTTLFLVVLFVLTATSLFGQSRVFNATHINVWLEDHLAGSDTTAIIGTKVQVTLTDPDFGTPSQISTVYADFSQFGRSPGEMQMVWDAAISKWKAMYQVAPGTLNGTSARVKIHSITQDENEQFIWDDVYFTVNNVPSSLTGVVINRELTNPGPTGLAIVGSTITVSFTSPDIVTAKLDLTYFGAGLMDMNKIGNTFSASYTVPAGNLAGNYTPTVIAWQTGIPNPGVATGSIIGVNNVLPTNSDILTSHLRVNNDANATFLAIGDILYVIGTLKTTGNSVVNKIWIDWAATGFNMADPTPIAYNVVNGSFTAIFQPEPGGISHTDSLKIKISKLQTTVGNVADITYWVAKNGATPPQHIVADLMPPSLLGVRDLFYNHELPLRFSPSSDPVDTFSTAPDKFKIKLTIPNWGTDDGIHSFKLKFRSENRIEFDKTYTYGDTLANGNLVVQPEGSDLYVLWDGAEDTADSTETTYSITLWDLYDQVGNPASLNHINADEVPYPEYDGTDASHHYLHSGGDEYEGESYVSRIHVVVDKLLPEFVQQFATVDSLDSHIYRIVNDLNGNNVWNTGEEVRYTYENGSITDSSGNPIDSVIDFQFQSKRFATVDTNPLRREYQSYWVVLTQQSSTNKWVYGNDGWESFSDFDQLTDTLEVDFGAPTDTGMNSEVMIVQWNISNFDFPGNASYILNAYIQDNAGNIVKSSDVNVQITDTFIKLPIIQDINILSEHITVVNGLPPVGANGYKNFYLNGGTYYNTKDSIYVEVSVNNREYLNDAINNIEKAVAIVTNPLGGTVGDTLWIKKSDFNADNKAYVSINANKIGTTAGSSSPGYTWELGGIENKTGMVNRSIQVISYAKPYTLNNNPYYLPIAAEDSVKFNLIIPPTPPQVPNQGVIANSMTASNNPFSPGAANDSYDATTNPADDEVKDTTGFSFSIPAYSEGISVRLQILDGTEIKRNWPTINIPADTTYTPSSPIIFDGLANNGLDPIVGATETKNLTWRLIVQPNPMADPYYVVPDSILTTKTITVDNTNPILISGSGTGTGTTVLAGEEHIIELKKGTPLTNWIPVVTQVDNQFEFTLYTDEYLTKSKNDTTGWSLQVRKEDGTEIMNNGTPVTALISSITASNGAETTGYKKFLLKVQIDHLEGTIENENAILVIRLPWDNASNPARHNDPSYPYNADVWYKDSSEYYLKFHILDAKPKITSIKFVSPWTSGVPTTWDGEAGYNADGTWNMAKTQAWISKDNYGTTNGKYYLQATVNGGVYHRAISTSWSANLSALLGSAYTAVVPDTASVQSNVNENDVWTLTWKTGYIPQNIAQAFVDNDTLLIPITIKLINSDNQVDYKEEQRISLKVDPKPVITALNFKYNGNNINTLIPGMTNVTIVANVTSTNSLLNYPLVLTTTGLTGGTFSPGTPTITGTAPSFVLTWNNITIPNWDWTPVTEFSKEISFKLTTTTVHGTKSADYIHEMVLLRKPSSSVKGIGTAIQSYTGTDPDGWFAPEHKVEAKYTFVSLIDNATNPPIEADFDAITDFSGNNRIFANAFTNGSSKSTTTYTLTRGSSTTSQIVYKYDAVWGDRIGQTNVYAITPDVQSVWNAYNDGDAASIPFYYANQIQSVVETKQLKVDKKVPTYNTSEMYIALGTSTPAAGSYELIENINNPIKLALETDGSWPSSKKIYIKYKAKDKDPQNYNGSGVLDIAAPTAVTYPSPNWTITQISSTPDTTNRTIEKVYSITKQGSAKPDSMLLTLGRVQDKVGHLNYSATQNSTDPAWTSIAPKLTFKFLSEYPSDVEGMAYKYDGSDWTNAVTTPYVKKGSPIGYKLRRIIPEQGRGVNVDSIEVTGIDLNTYWVTNKTTNYGESWKSLTLNADGWYYLQQPVNVATSYANNDTIKFEYRINYSIHYTDDTNVTTATKKGYLPFGARVDDSIPQFVSNQKSVFIWSETLGQAQEGYVVPDDEDGELRIIFTDQKYNDAVPTVVIDSLDQFVSNVGATITNDINSPNYSNLLNVAYIDSLELTIRNTVYHYYNVWVASLSGMHIYEQNPPILSTKIEYDITDPIGNGPLTGNRFVEIAANGPIVPIIQNVTYKTQLFDGSWVNGKIVATQTINGETKPAQKIEVQIKAQYKEYIETVTITPPAGITFNSTFNLDTDLVLTNPTENIYTATFTITNVGGLPADSTTLTFTVKTTRHPYGQDMFTHTVPFGVVVDGHEFESVSPVIAVKGKDAHSVLHNDLISPENEMVVTVQVENLGEDFNDKLPDLSAMSNWFALTSTPSNLLTSNIPSPVISDSHLATWTIPADSIADLDIAQASITITYKNIYGLTQTVTHNFNVDDIAPQYAGMQLYLGDDVKADDSSGSFFYDDSWDKIRVNFIDLPEHFVGLDSVQVSFIPDPVTYNYDSIEYPQAAAALASMQYSPFVINANGGSGYVDITFSAPYTGTTLANGNYIIKIKNLKDKFGAKVDSLMKTFVWQYNPAEMTLYINGIQNNASLNVSDAPVNIIANTNSTVPIEGVEFRLYYDADGDEDFTGDDLVNDISNHLSGTPDMVFPYDVYWNMEDSLYAFVQDSNYTDRDYRGFWLRASAITQNRDLYDTYRYLKVYDDVAPIPLPNLTPIVKTINYADTTSNYLNIPVSFNIRDAAQVQVVIKNQADSTIVDTVIEPINNPLGENLVRWDFGLTPGIYITEITAWDYTALNFNGEPSEAVPGPKITLENAISDAEAVVNIYHEGINTEEWINNDEYSSFPTLDDDNYIVLEGIITNPSSIYQPLNGISAVRFVAHIVNNINVPETDTVFIGNNINEQPQYPETGIIPKSLINIVNNNTTGVVRIAVPNDIFNDYLEEDTDYTFKFKMRFIPEPGFEDIEMPEDNRPYSQFSVDQIAPSVTLTNISTNDPVSWAPGKQGSFSVTPVNPVYDNATEIATTLLEWSVDGTNWFTTVPQLSYDALTGAYKALNWNIAGGFVNTFLGENYFGPVQIRAIVTDDVANADTVYLAIPINVDNQAPETRFTHIIHSINYPNLTEITDIPNAADEISIVTSSQQGTNGASNLRLFVDAGTLGTDNVMPLMMYQRTPDGIWQPVEYDHEAWNLGNITYPELFEFEIPYSLLSAGQHRFVVVRRDAMGNLEGDKASETVAYNNKLNNAEKNAATDLIVNVTSIDDVVATIEYPEDMAFISGKKALTANTTDNNVVEYIRFEHKVNDVWQPIATTAKATTQTITFDLDLDQLVWAPGVHLIANSNVLGELVYDGNSWNGSFELNVGTTYNFQYGIDINNNGTWDQGEPLIDDIHGFTTFTPMPWTINFNSADYAQGIHEFRAVPLDTLQVELEHYQAPSSYMIIDNIAPVINNITSVGNVTNATPDTNVDFVTDVEELLVAADDIVEVRYQYSGIPASEMNRQWNIFDLSDQMDGNYPVTWQAPNPLFDNLDNNANGLVDEAEEANSNYYIRSIAIDKAGNFAVSTEFAVNVDTSPAKMALTKIEDVLLVSTNYVYAINADSTNVTLTATEIPTGFDPATEAEFFYKFKEEVTETWPTEWIPIGQRVNVINSEATAELDFIQEGYYQFKVVAYDALGNNEATITNVIFNDVTGPEITFVQVGTRPVISEKYAFAKQANLFNGELKATLSDIAGVNTVTFEYSTTGIDNWVNITTLGAGSIVPDGTGGGTVTYNWEYFPTRSPVLYLRAIAQDTNANNMSTEVIKLYVDTLPPNVEVVNLTHIMYADTLMAVDRTKDVNVTLNYTDLNNEDLLDIANVKLRFYNSAGNIVLSRNKNYNDVGMADTLFTFTPVQMADMGEDIDSLYIILKDFAGNTATIIPEQYKNMYFDVYPPAIQSVASLAPNMNNTVSYNHPITFNVNYNDLIGLPADALKVRFKINGIARDSVQTYIPVDSTNITFTWTPIDFDNYFANGNMNDIIVSAELTLKDYMEHTSPVENFNINVTYGIPNVARIMAITDVQNGEPIIHYVNWNNPVDLSIGYINEPIGMNQDGTGTPIKLYAYVPHNAEIPDSISFAYRAISSSNWVHITTISNGDPSWDFIDPSFMGQFQSQFTTDWNVVGLDSGTYEVRATGNYNSGSTASIITVNIYNDTIVPQVAVENIEAGNIVQRGETYTLTSNFTNTDYLSAVRYRYRYVNVNGNEITPVSSWTDFGDDQNGGIPTEVWNDATTNYGYDWFVAPYYLFNNTMQIVAQAKDIWGTITPISSVITGNAYAIANIRDTQAPDAAISYTWNGFTYPDLDPEPDWVSGVVDSTMTITATITSDVMLADLVRVEFQFNDELIGTVNAENGVLLNNEAYLNWFELPDEESVTSGVLKVITYDVYGNTNEVTKTLNIDNVLPTADFTVPEEIERETTLVLNANPIDNLSGLLNVTYAYAPVTDPASPWIHIETVVETPWTSSWIVPEDLIFGAEYIVQAKVTDIVGNVLNVTDTFTVIDNQTPMQIISVAGHIPVNGIIPVRLHNNVNVVTQVNDVSIPRVEYVIRAVGTTDWNHLEYANVVGTDANVLLTDVLITYAEGDYELGVRAREARVTLGQVSDIVTITIDHSFALTATETVPASNGFFNGETFTVNFTVNTDDEIEPSSIALQYHIIGIDGANDPWRDPVLGNAEVTRTGTNTYLATFSGIEIYHHDDEPLNGMFDFRFSVSDLAEETPNIDNNTIITNVMYDTTDPEIVLNGITGTGVTENEGNYTIQLATTATLDVNAFDVLYGQITQVASGIEKVEIWYNYNGVDVLMGTDTESPYSIDWNTAGLAVGDYLLGILAYDKAGNVNGVAKTVTIVPPVNWEPYALITAMSFNGDNANQDILYAEVANWNNEDIEAVTFEYFANDIWTPFATIANPAATPFPVQFNAELMNAATKIRTVVTYNDGLISTNKPELNVAYDAAEGGKLVVSNPTITANVFYNNEVRISGALSAPIVTTLYNGVYANTPAVQIVNGTPTAFFDVPNPGEYEFWSASIDYENWVMQLNSTMLNTTNIGTITHNGIALTVPNGSFAYYENVEPAIALPLGYTELSNPAQTAFILNPQGDINLTVTLAATPDPAAGTIVGMYYNGNQWSNVTANVTGNVVTFTAPSGFIYAVGQYTGTVDFNVVFNSIEPQYINATNNELWTVANPSTIKFFVYDGFTDGGYTTPAAGEITYQMYIDEIAVPASYDNGFITAANILDLTAGEHIASVMVTRNNVNISAEKVFKVDITAPVIVATGTQLTVTDRTLSATITDPETAINDVHLYVMGWNSDITVPLANMTVSGNTYSYTLTMDDLNALGYDINYTMEMQAVWYADNNLEMNSVTEPVNYTVNIEGPAITFTGFANGWWLNPTFNTPLTFTVTVPEGRTIPADGVWIDLAEVTPLGENQIQQMTLAPVSVSGNVYSYSFNFGQLLSPMATAVKLYVEAIDNYNIYNESEQTYGIDMAAPVVWALAPVGAPIDNDGDGLFNEDVPNGVNEDMDWVDLDQDGFWDPEEPQIVDEDPLDYYPATLAQGTDVVVAIAFEDFQGIQILMRGDDSGRTGEKNSRTPIWYYTGTSGIDVTDIHVTLNGATVTGTITNGTFTHDAGILPAGHYTVVAAVGDIVGNVGSLGYEFDVVGGAPTIVINPLNGNWWLNTTGSNTFTFTVTSVAQLANGGVVANIYAEPSNTIIQGPITPTAGANNQYSVILYGGVVPADQTAVRLEVIATDVWGGTSTSNQTFLIDNNAPVITILTPAAGTEFAYNEQVSITATVTDNVGTRDLLKTSKDTQDRSGSGLQTVTMTVTPPTGTPIVFSNLTGAIAEIVTANQYGNYTVAITAKDVVGNESVASTNFVVPAPAPEIIFQSLANGSWWLNSTNNNKLSFTVNTAGINLAVGGVVANVYTIPANALFQGPVIPTAVNDVYSIDVMGGVIPVDQTGIRLEVTATNILGGTSTSNQVYGIDNSAPVITINSPAESAQFNPGATVNIMATISDIVGTKGMGMRSMLNGPKDKTGSGIDEVYLTVFDPNGVIVVTDSTTAQVISKPLIVTEYGTYTINILAKDNVGNQAMANRNFIVTPATAPTISFTDIAWLNSVGSNNLSFTINAVVPVNVTANVITYPSGATLMGPLSVNPEGGIYTVILNGGMIPAGETSVRLQVIATDQFGNVTEANHYYGVDRSTPIITILNPVNGAEITLVDESTKVRIEAQISDLIPPLKNGGKNSSGSGIAGSRMVIIDPLGMVISDVTAGADTTEISKEITNLMLGTYTVRVTAWDNAGNQAMVSITFTMIAAPLPPAELAISDAYAYPNPSIDGTAKFAVTLTNGAYVKIHIYDFAGREVRTLSSSGKVQGKSKAEIVFDGRNNDGVKLARGAYFARVIANDGTKIVEKVVKIAIK